MRMMTATVSALVVVMGIVASILAIVILRRYTLLSNNDIFYALTLLSYEIVLISHYYIMTWINLLILAD